MNVLAWIAFIGLCIQAGGVLVSWGTSLWNPAASAHLYPRQDLSRLRQVSLAHYSTALLLMAAVSAVEAYTAYLVIKVLSKIKLSSPFTMEIARSLERISYWILGTWVLAMIKNVHAEWVQDQVPGLNLPLISGDFIVMAGVVFVTAQIFKKGVEIQTENELTV